MLDVLMAWQFWAVIGMYGLLFAIVILYVHLREKEQR